MVGESQIPASIMRDAEFSAAAVRGLLGLSSTEVNRLFTGASITGQVITFTRNNGTTVTITIPAGGGTGMADGVVASGAFNADATELILTLDTGETVTVNVPAILRQSGGGGGTPTEQRVLQQDPVGTAATYGKLQIDPNGNAYSVIPDIQLGVLATGDFDNFDHANYIGAFSGDPNPLSVPLGTYFFLTVDHKLRKTANNAFGQARWQDAPWSELLPTGARYRGNHHGDADALHHLSMTGDVYHNDTAPHIGIRQVDNFVAGSQEHTDYGTRKFAFADEIPDMVEFFTKRSTLPAVTGDSPDLVFLTHDHSVGDRADAVITVGFRNGVAGYSSGDISAALGSINVDSPLLEVFGLGVSGDYLVESIYWDNRADLEEFSKVWLNSLAYTLGPVTEVPGGAVFLRRIVSYPTGLATATLNVNYERADGSFYHNNGATSVEDPGLWEKIDNGQGATIYDRLATRSVLHRDGVGAPQVAPHKAGLVYLDDLGRQWNSAGQVVRVLTPPTGASEVMPLSELGAQYVPDPSGYADLQDRGGIGAWYAERYSHNLVQLQGDSLADDLVLVLTWIDVWTWLIGNVAGYDTAPNHFRRDETTFLGAFASERHALEELQFVLSGEVFPAVATHQYVYTDSSESGMSTSRFRRVTAFAPGQVVRSDDFHWVGPVATQEYVDSLFGIHEAKANIHHTPPTGPGGTPAPMRIEQSRVPLGSTDLTTNGVGTLTLSEPIIAGETYEIEGFGGATGTAISMFLQRMFSGDAFLELSNAHVADPPTNQNRAMRFSGVSPTAGATSHTPGVVNLWRGATQDQNLYVNHSTGRGRNAFECSRRSTPSCRSRRAHDSQTAQAGSQPGVWWLPPHAH